MGRFHPHQLDGDTLLMITNRMISSYAFEIGYVLSTILGITEDIIRMHKILDQENVKSSSPGHIQTQMHKDTHRSRHIQTYTEIYTHRHTCKQIHINTETQTHRHTQRHSCRDREIDMQKYT